MKISELKRVVNVDKFSKYAKILNDSSNTNERQIERILKELAKKTPSRDVLIETKLGFILKDVASREGLSSNLREKAKEVRQKWKDFHKQLLLAPKFDVKCDLPTTMNREKSRKKIFDSFLPDESSQDTIFHLSSQIEFELFQKNENLLNLNYFNAINKCCTFINDNLSLQNDLINELTSIQDLIKQVFCK